MKHTVYKACEIICYDDVLSPGPIFIVGSQFINLYGVRTILIIDSTIDL